MQKEERNPGADATGLIQSLEAQAPDSLLRKDVAEQFVRGFVFRIFRAAWDRKRLGFASVQAECGYAAKILAGKIQGAKFSIDPTWHPDRLAAFVRKQLGDALPSSTPDEGVLESFMYLIAKRALDVLPMPEPEQEPAVDRLVADTIALLLGIPIDGWEK